jgi:hypothetical protein
MIMIVNESIGDKGMTEQESFKLVAPAWCGEKTKHKVMDPELAFEFARILRREVNKHARRVYKIDDLHEEAWGIIANVDWSKQTPEWQAAAARFRDKYNKQLTEQCLNKSLEERWRHMPTDDECGWVPTRPVKGTPLHFEPDQVVHLKLDACKTFEPYGVSVEANEREFDI